MGGANQMRPDRPTPCQTRLMSRYHARMVRADRAVWAAVVASVTTLILVSCGGGGNGAKAVTATTAMVPTSVMADGATTTVTSTSAPAVSVTHTTAPTTQTPGERYLAIIAPANQLAATFGATMDVAAQARILQDLSTVLGLIAVQLGGVNWPGPAQSPVAELVDATRAAEAAADNLLSNPSPETTSTFTTALALVGDVSSRVRLALGLPPQIGS